jgi:hypothetical protein
MIYVVTGLMRSGTSVLAEHLHELGVPMGTQMRFPHNSRGQFDWEDIEFTDTCLQGIINNENPREFFAEYIQKRKGDIFGVKSPFVLPFIRTFRTAANRLGHEVKVITTARPYYDTIHSLRQQLPDDDTFRFVCSIQHRLEGCWRGRPDLTIDINETWLSPTSVREKLANLIGVDTWA